MFRDMTSLMFLPFMDFLPHESLAVKTTRHRYSALTDRSLALKGTEPSTRVRTQNQKQSTRIQVDALDRKRTDDPAISQLKL
jgi:hypothetical protein